MQTDKTKQLTRQKAELSARGRAKDVVGAPLAHNLSDSQRRSGEYTAVRQTYRAVPVVSVEGRPLMPTIPSRARRWVRSGKATPFFKRGIFCVRLNQEPSDTKRQEVVVGIDPGSKREGLTVKSEVHTFLNVQAEAVTWVSQAVEVRRNMRRGRRFRKTPCRANRTNRARGGLSPSTKARWQWKLRIVEQLSKIFPMTDLVVEDIKAKTKGRRRWDKSFSPLEVGKDWFYKNLEQFGKVHLRQGWETKELRDAVGLKKSKSKLAERFDAHCVDSWVLANSVTGGHVVPENTAMLLIAPIRLHRRQLHALQPAVGDVRRLYGSTRSLGLKRGSLVKHPKYGYCYVGGTSNGRVSLHSLEDGQRLCRNTRPEELKFRSFNTYKRKEVEASSVA